MKPKVDKEKCIGCGTCVGICPAVFVLGVDGKAEVNPAADFGANEEAIKQSIDSCPVGAISAE